MRNKGNRRRSNINPKKKGEDSSLVPKSYECDQLGHLRVDRPICKRRMEKPDKKTFKDKKGKKVHITWVDNDMDSSSDLENEIVNLGLMAKDYESE